MLMNHHVFTVLFNSVSVHSLLSQNLICLVVYCFVVVYSQVCFCLWLLFIRSVKEFLISAEHFASHG